MHAKPLSRAPPVRAKNLACAFICLAESFKQHGVRWVKSVPDTWYLFNYSTTTRSRIGVKVGSLVQIDLGNISDKIPGSLEVGVPVFTRPPVSALNARPLDHAFFADPRPHVSQLSTKIGHFLVRGNHIALCSQGKKLRRAKGRLWISMTSWQLIMEVLQDRRWSWRPGK